MLPMFNIDFKKINSIFKNCYLSYNSLNFDVPIIIVHLDKKIENFFDSSLIIDELEEFDSYLYILKIPENFYDDYELLLKGKYSKISKELLKLIENLWGNDSQPYKVVTKNPLRKQWLEDVIGEKLPKEAELMSIFDLENQEILKLNKLKIC